MKPFNYQKVFDKVSKHLLTQNEKSRTDDDEPLPTCLYRRKDGRKCAIGILIDDRHYSPLIEFKSVSFLEVRNAVEASLGVILDNASIDFLGRLQSVHDDHKVKDWPKELRKIADEFKLTVNFPV